MHVIIPQGVSAGQSFPIQVPICPEDAPERCPVQEDPACFWSDNTKCTGIQDGELPPGHCQSKVGIVGLEECLNLCDQGTCEKEGHSCKWVETPTKIHESSWIPGSSAYHGGGG